MSNASPFVAPQGWDVVKLGDQTSPGYCEWSGWKRENKWDVKEGKGTVGATITYVGKPPAKGSFTFHLWRDEHYQAWLKFAPLFAYDPTKQNVQAIQISHPALAFIGITQVVTEKLGAPEHKGGGHYEVKAEMLEYFPPPPTSAVSTPSGSAARTDVFTKPPAPDSDASTIASLMQQASQP